MTALGHIGGDRREQGISPECSRVQGNTPGRREVALACKVVALGCREMVLGHRKVT